MRAIILSYLAVTAAGLATPALAATDACSPLADIQFSTPPQFETQAYVFKSDGVSLEGCLYKPKGLARFPVVIAVAGSDEAPTAAQVYYVIHAKAFAAKGVGFFSFNKRGFGNSGGTPNDMDFPERARDVANAVDFIRAQPFTDRIGLIGFSQGAWALPLALRRGDGVAGVMMTSPSGVNPYEQISHFVHGVALRLGLSAEDAAKAEAAHRAVFRYYATGRGYEAAQALVRGYAAEPWFETFRTNQEWDEKIGPGGALLTPSELREAWAKRPDDFGIYRRPNSFADYRPTYARLDRPTIIFEGSADQDIPAAASEAAIRAALRPSARKLVMFKTFEGAEHSIQDGPRVRAAYLAMVSDWAALHLKG